MRLLRRTTTAQSHWTPSRLSAKKLRSYGEAIAGFIGCAPWSETSRWQPFMSDVSALADGMVKLAAAMDKNAAAKETARKETVPLRAPDREEDVVGSEFKEPCAPHDCLAEPLGADPAGADQVRRPRQDVLLPLDASPRGDGTRHRDKGECKAALATLGKLTYSLE